MEIINIGLAVLGVIMIVVGALGIYAGARGIIKQTEHFGILICLILGVPLFFGGIIVLLAVFGILF